MVLLPHLYLIMYRLYYKSWKVTSSGVRVEFHYDLIIGERIPELLSSIGERSRGSLSLGKLGYCHQVLCSPLLRIPLPGTGNQNTDTEILTAAPRSTLPILWLSITDPDLDTALGAESLLLRIRLTN